MPAGRARKTKHAGKYDRLPGGAELFKCRSCSRVFRRDALYRHLNAGCDRQESRAGGPLPLAANAGAAASPAALSAPEAPLPTANHEPAGDGSSPPAVDEPGGSRGSDEDREFGHVSDGGGDGAWSGAMEAHGCSGTELSDGDRPPAGPPVSPAGSASSAAWSEESEQPSSLTDCGYSGSSSDAGSGSDGEAPDSRFAWYDAVAGADGCSAEGTPFDARASKVARLRAVQHDPVHSQCSVRLLEAVHAFLALKADGGLPNHIFERMLHIVTRLLPAGHTLPSSYYLCKALVGASIDISERHVCPACLRHCFEHLPRHEWQSHAEQPCPRCGKAERFNVAESNTARTLITPRKPVFSFGLQRVLQAWASSPDFLAEREQGRSEGMGGFLDASEARRLGELGIDVAADNVLSVHLGLDWGSLYLSAHHSMGALFIRLAGLSGAAQARSSFTDLLVIIPGKREPSELEGYLSPALAALAGAAPGGAGVWLDVAVPGDGGVRTERRRFFVVVTSFFADTPARAKLMKALGTGAHLNCNYCLFQATRGPRGGMYPMGYADPARQDMLATRSPLPLRARRPNNPLAVESTEATACGWHVPFVKVGHPLTLLTHEKMVQRAQLVESGRVKAKQAGCNGLSPVIARLAYASYKATFPLAISHALQHGLGRGWLDLLIDGPKAGSPGACQMLSAEGRHRVAQRTTCIGLTVEHGRSPKDITVHKGLMTMEDVLHFFESVGPLVFREGVLPTKMEEAFWLLRAIMLHYVRASSVPGALYQYTPESRRQAQENARRLAQLYHEGVKADEFPLGLLTPNMHSILCRAYDQEEELGPLSAYVELWLERGIKKVKRIVGGKVASEVARHVAGAAELDLRLREVQASEELRPPEQWDECDEPRHPRLCCGLDDGDDGHQLLGAGQRLSGASHSAATAAVERLLQERRRAQQLDGWQVGDTHAPGCVLRRYTRAHVTGVGMLAGSGYGRAVSKVSSWLLLQYRVGTRLEERIAQAHCFFKVELEGRPAMRLVKCTTFARQDSRGVVRRISLDRVREADCMTDLCAVAATLVSCAVRDPRPIDRRTAHHTRWFDRRDEGKVFFVQSATSSRCL